MATKTVAEMLRIKPHSSLWSTRPEYLERIGPLPDGVKPADSINRADTAILFVDSKASAREILANLKDQLDMPKVLWIAFPHDGDVSDIDRETLGPILAEYRRRPVSRQVAIDDTWAAMRFGRMKPGEQPFTAAAAHTSGDSRSDLPAGLSAPAQGALAEAGVTTLDDLTRFSKKEILQLHGIGPKSMPPLEDALAERGLSFREGP